MRLFTAPHWLETSLSCWPASLGHQIVTLPLTEESHARCVIGRRAMSRHGGLVQSRVLAFNQSLDTAWDQVFVEYNGFFDADPAHFPALLERLLERLKHDPHWDEFRLAGLTSRDAQATIHLGNQYGLDVRVVDTRPTFARQLARDRMKGSTLFGLSANTRAQIRRSRRLIISTLGPIQLQHATSVEQSIQWFDEAGSWHRRRWGDRSGRKSSSGFDNPAFVRFHHALIRSAHPSGQVRLWRVSAGSKALAWLYNFRIDQVEAFYLGSWDPDLDPGMRAGLIAHQEVMDACLEEGVETYDFMAGDSRYKRQLANESSELHWLIMQRPRWRFTVEDQLRKLKHWLLRDRLPET